MLTAAQMNQVEVNVRDHVHGVAGVLGEGFKFPATQVPSADANTLDDYEEGTFTPSLGGTATYTVQTGTYTKIGRLVFINIRIDVNTIGTGSTSAVSGLPFTPDALTYATTRATLLAIAIVSVVSQINTDSTITILSRTAASTSDTNNAILGNASVVRISGCHQT